MRLCVTLQITVFVATLLSGCRIADKQAKLPQADMRQLFERHKQSARGWVSRLQTVRLTKSHYAPYHETLSVVLDGNSPIRLRYYFTHFGKKGYFEDSKYPYHDTDILVEFDLREETFKIIHPKETPDPNKNAHDAAGAGHGK